MRKIVPALAAFLLFGSASVANAEVPKQVAQQNRSPMDSEYQNRLRSAQTPQERLKAENDRHMQQGALPDHDHSDIRIRTAPGTAGSGTLPYTPGDTRAQPGESPSGGGGVPRGQGGE